MGARLRACRGASVDPTPNDTFVSAANSSQLAETFRSVPPHTEVRSPGKPPPPPGQENHTSRKYALHRNSATARGKIVLSPDSSSALENAAMYEGKWPLRRWPPRASRIP